MRISKSNKTDVKASTKAWFDLDPTEKRELKARLYDRLDTISEYHTDLTPKRSMSLDTLIEYLFAWADDYNDGYLGDIEEHCEDRLDRYLVNKYKVHRGEYRYVDDIPDDVDACGDIKGSKKLSANDQALSHIKAAIDILGKSGKKDDVTKDSIANLATVMFDIKSSKKN